MGHDHSHHHHGVRTGETRNILTAFWLNTVFAVIQILGGFYTNSVAILSGAVHDLGDCLSLGFAYYFQKKSARKKDQVYTYGYQRFSLLGAFVNSVILIVSSVFVIRESVIRLFEPEAINAEGMVLLAVLGVVINGLAFLQLKKGASINEKVVALHFVEDVLGWVAILAGSFVMMFADVLFLDPVLSIAIAAYILYNVFRSLRSTFKILLQRRPDSVDEQAVRKKVLSVPGVKDLHDLHFWTMDGTYNVMTLHVVVDRNQSIDQREQIKKEVKHELEHLDIQHSTVEIESEDENCRVG